MAELHPLNLQVANHLRTISQLYVMDDPKKQHRRITAFKDAAEKIVALTESVAEVNVKKLKGIGKSTAEVIEQFVKNGTSERLEKLGQTWPVEALTMTVVTGIGPKTALQFHREGIHNLDELVSAAQVQDSRIAERHLPNILAAVTKQNGRVPHDKAQAIADKVIAPLKHLTLYGSTIQVCGSLRRKTKDSKDIDIIVHWSHVSTEVALDNFCELGEVINRGDRKVTLRVTHDDVQMNVDLWMVEEWYLGAALVYATGSKDHCVALRARAKARGFLLNEYGIFRPDCDGYTKKNQLCGKTEEDVYKFLGLDWIEPENRTGDLP